MRREQGREFADYGVNEEIEKNRRHWASLAESSDSHGGKEREAVDGGIVSGMRVQVLDERNNVFGEVVVV